MLATMFGAEHDVHGLLSCALSAGRETRGHPGLRYHSAQPEPPEERTP